jgi:hypothetical protein
MLVLMMISIGERMSKTKLVYSTKRTGKCCLSNQKRFSRDRIPVAVFDRVEGIGRCPDHPVGRMP